MKTRFVLAAAAVLLHVAAASHPTDAPSAEDLRAATVGVVAFANSGAPRAQADFLYGLAQLHNFQYQDAAVAFRRAQEADPGFALAYWGEAMTNNHAVWMQQDANAARAVLVRLAPDRAARLAKAGTDRERAYLEAVEILYGDGDKFERDRLYAKAMQRLHERWPDDVDATAFYALALLGTAHAGRDVPTYMKAYALLEEPFRQYPQHPGVAHYLVHSVDDAAHAPLGLKAARAYAKIAPESPHALHMASHIYLALGLWDEVVAANENALAVGARRASQRGARPPRCGHGHIWLNYGYLQQGRYAAAKRLIARCLAEMSGRSPINESGQFDPEDSAVGTFYTMRLRYLLDAPPDSEVLGWAPEPGPVLYAAFLRDYGAAILAARRGAADQFGATAAQAAASAARLHAEMDRLNIEPDSPYRRVLAIQVGQLDGARRLFTGDRVEGVSMLEAVASQEDALPAAFGPPQVDEPTRELLGAMLAPSDASKARLQFERALVLNPGRVGPRRGLMQAERKLGNTAAADAIEADLEKTLKHADTGAAHAMRQEP
ncbi:MAG: hypothetical protein JF607_22320 [Burkholderiales bacterium]|jgi:tetratricopeptide (TPR) repeat protein|nr:hypothetical protein [Burkholderiales bacterium]MBW8893462.1 hypothetical protein [Burkholderiales bacterium]